METAGPAEWTTGDIRLLLETMKQSIANRQRNKAWSTGLKSLDWEIVSFRQFTPEQCSAKWDEIMQKLRKVKTLTELIVDAQCAMDNPDNKINLQEDTQKNRPKKPVTAHGLYFAENKGTLMKRNPGICSRDLMKLANERYKKLPPKDKDRYVKEANKAREQYLISLEKWRRLHQLDEKTQKTKNKADKANKNKSIKKKKKPCEKQPLNGYNLFCKEQQSLLIGIPLKNIPTVWARRWKKLSKEEKETYSQRCSAMKKKVSFMGEPKIPTRSICGLYCKKTIAEMKGKVEDGRKLLPKVARQSKTLSTQERAKYQAEIENNLRIYQEKLQKWFKTLTPTQQVQYCHENPTKLKYLQSRLPASHHRTSDSEDEDIEDSSSDEDLTVIEIDDEDEEENENMFDLF